MTPRVRMSSLLGHQEDQLYLLIAPPPPGPVVSQAVRQPAAGFRGAHPAGGPAPGPVAQAPVPDAHGAGRQRRPPAGRRAAPAHPPAGAQRGVQQHRGQRRPHPGGCLQGAPQLTHRAVRHRFYIDTHHMCHSWHNSSGIQK